MKILIAAVFASLAPFTAATTTAATAAAATSARPAPTAGHLMLIDGLCDGHRWSLFGCRPDHPRVHQPDTDWLPSVE